MAIEYELKYQATPELLSLLRQALPGEEAQLTMSSTYYDTPDRILSSMHYTLRHRTENDRHVCTLKTPANGAGRGEWEIEEAFIDAAFPVLCKLSGASLSASVKASSLVAVCGAQFTRITKTLTFGDSLLEIALDSGLLTGGEKTCPLCEVEVELKSGNTADADAFAAQLSSTFSLQPQPLSKYRRALALSTGE